MRISFTHIMNTHNEPKRYAGGRLRDVLDPWREMLFRCENCGLESLGKDLDPGDLHQAFFTRECPDCAHNVVSIALPHVTEMLDNREYYPYFIDACKVLRQKYGNRLHDVIPTERTLLALWGDEIKAPEIVEGMRELIRKASRIGNWTHLPIDPCQSWETYGA